MFGRVYLAILTLGACSFDMGNQIQENSDSGPTIDGTTTDAATDAADAAPIDATPDATPDTTPDAMVCVGDDIGFPILNLERCDPLTPIASLVLDDAGAYTLDTTLRQLTDPNGAVVDITSVIVSKVALGVPDLLVVSVTDMSIAVGTRLRITGTRFPVFVALGDITIDGQLRVVGRRFNGPGGDHSVDCVLRRGESGTNGLPSPSLGAGGAGFARSGGDGGAIPGLGLQSLQGGASESDSDLVPLRGGCAGGRGGGNGGGLGGGAGGAVELVARDSIQVTGVISASGGRGLGVTDDFSGGGGGGSGGGILLQSPNNMIPGILSSNGGGGGEGSRTSTTTGAGQHGRITNGSAASGGGDVSSGGDGGNGGTNDGLGGLVALDGENGEMSGSGGGGGAAGYVVLVTP